MLSSTLPLLLLALPLVSADICYDYYNRPYTCYNNGLSYGARIGIGIGVAAGILALFMLCGYWKRRNLRNQWSKYRPPALPVHNGVPADQNYSYGQGNNPYANNPPPPTGMAGQGSDWNHNQYGNNPPPPAQTYQPSMAGQYGDMARNSSEASKVKATPTPGMEATSHEHGYEWEQAREAERLERERGGLEAPPGYDVSAATTPQNTGGYAPPPGPPPTGK